MFDFSIVTLFVTLCFFWFPLVKFSEVIWFTFFLLVKIRLRVLVICLFVHSWLDRSHSHPRGSRSGYVCFRFLSLFVMNLPHMIFLSFYFVSCHFVVFSTRSCLDFYINLFHFHRRDYVYGTSSVGFDLYDIFFLIHFWIFLWFISLFSMLFLFFCLRLTLIF